MVQIPPPLFIIMQTKEERLKKRKERRVRRKEKIRKAKEEIKKEFKLNAPNILTLLRLILTFFIVYMVFSGYSRISIAMVFAITALTDWFDGIVARRFKQTSFIGARLDQVIDRIFTAVVFLIFLIYALTNNNNDKLLIMLILVVSREIVGLPGIVVRVIRQKDLYEVLYIGKITNWIQGIAFTLIIADFSFALYPAIIAGLVGIYSGFTYLKHSFE